MHAYLGGVAGNLEVVPLAIGGVADHVHLLIGIRATHTLAEVIRQIKAVSSHWVHEEIGMEKFSWQEGYGAFTVSPSQCQSVADYIADQEDHHRKRSFKEEYRSLLEKSGVEFDEKYLW
ncbi:MAG: transposase [Verrucomicrobiota bacterium]